MASSMGFIDSSVTAIALPAIRTSLGGSLAAAQWVTGAYLLTLSSLILVGGAASDRFGVVRVFAMGIIAFVLSSVLCTIAQDMIQLNAARSLQGAGAALMVPGSMTLIARAYPREQRGAALGLWAAASTATTAFGPVLGGLLLTLGGPEIWRTIFAINLPLGVGALWLLRRYALADKGRPGTPLDIAGAALATLGLGLLSWSLTEEGASTGPLLVAATALVALFLLWEARSKAPMIRLGMFASRAFAAANLATFLLYTGLIGVMFYLPMTAISVWQVSAFGVTAAFLPTSVMITLFSARSGRLADRLGPGPLMAAGAAIVALGYAAIAFNAHKALFFTHTVPFMFVVGVGMALLVAPLTAAVMASAADKEQGAASGINNAVARVAGLIAVAVMGRVARWSYGAITPDHPGFGLPGTSPSHIAATSTAFAHIAACAAALALASALVSALGLRRETMPLSISKG
jgi:EmrB/QacA subfamily drug resistance transporter